MSLLKDEKTTRLDDLHRAGAEALGLYQDLEARVEDETLRAVLVPHIDAQRGLLERVAELRRETGQLPQAADPEVSHLEAAGALVRAAVLPGGTETHYVESILDAAADVDRHLGEALSLDLDGALRRLLESFQTENQAFERALRDRR